MEKKIIVMTPIMNDDWILDSYLKAVTSFADHIILLDQQSSDRTNEIIKNYEKVELHRNINKNYNEKERQELLIKKARFYGDRNVLIALDVDEFFTPEFYLEKNLKWLKSLNPGISISFNWANLHWHRKMFWRNKMPPIIYIDDGQDYSDLNTFHRTRVPVSKKRNVLTIESCDVIHLQFLEISRVKEKHKWYQLYEVTNMKNRNFVQIYRKYHHMQTIQKRDLTLIPESWILFLGSMGIDLKLQDDQNIDNWCRSGEISLMKSQISQKQINKLDLEFNFDIDTAVPQTQSKFDNLVYKYLKITQRYYRHSNLYELIRFVPIKIIDSLIGKVWR